MYEVSKVLLDVRASYILMHLISLSVNSIRLSIASPYTICLGAYAVYT